MTEINEQDVLHEAITFTSHDSVLGHDSWSVNVRATVEKLHEAGYCIAALDPGPGDLISSLHDTHDDNWTRDNHDQLHPDCAVQYGRDG